MGETNPLQTIVDDLKAKLLGAQTERDQAKGEIDTVKKTGGTLLDENAALSRQLDDAKKNIANLAKGLAGGVTDAKATLGDKPPDDGKPVKESIFAWLTGFVDKAWYFPHQPPEKKTES